jgi:Xaa-Pro dipeptidase
MTGEQKSDIYFERQKKLALTLEKAGLDGLVLNPGPSLTYLTGLHFHLSERPVVCFFTPRGEPVLVLPELESAKAKDTAYELSYLTYSEDLSTWGAAFQNGMDNAGLRKGKVGVEPRRLRVLELRLLEEASPGTEFDSAEGTIADMRMRKDPGEVEAMRIAVEIAQKALESTLPFIKVGVTELEVAAELTLQLLRHHSAPQLPFYPIVASGPGNSANPHAFPGNRVMVPGDLLVIDWGATCEGYYSDITRSFAVGEVDEELRRIHQITLEANEAGRAAAAPGVTCGEVDRAARKVIEQAGYGEFFIHRTGHGLGMESHEAPYIRDGNPRVLEPGMSFTIEPGIYLPGRGGVRVEDDVVVTRKGLECMTDLPRELVQVG